MLCKNSLKRWDSLTHFLKNENRFNQIKHHLNAAAEIKLSKVLYRYCLITKLINCSTTLAVH